MTDMELIKALRHCAGFVPECDECPLDSNYNCIDDAKITAADRLEALLVENDLLYREVAKLKAECDHFRDLTKKMWCEKRYGEDTNVPTKWVSANERLPESADHSVLVVVHGLYENTNGHRAILLQNAVEIATYFRDDEKWLIEAYPQWEIPYVTHWMPIPEPPGTEGVE